MPEVVGEGMRALVVDDEEVVRSVVLEVLEGMGFVARPAESLADARKRLTGEAWDLLIIDKNLPDGSGLTLVREVGEGSLDAQIVVMSGYATLSSAVEALQAGGRRLGVAALARGRRACPPRPRSRRPGIPGRRRRAGPFRRRHLRDPPARDGPDGSGHARRAPPSHARTGPAGSRIAAGHPVARRRRLSRARAGCRRAHRRCR